MSVETGLDDAAVTALNERFEAADPQAIVRWAIETFGDELSVGASFGGPGGMAILHMAAQLKPNVHVFVLDTDYLFEETHQTQERATSVLGLENVEVYKPGLTHDQQAAEYGAALWMRDPDRCCDIRKVEPTGRALAGKSAWIAGLRRDQSEGRAEIDIVARNLKLDVIKINPLANWTEKETWAYVVANGVPYNPLLDQGFVSIGCYNCTVPGKQGRQGRWEGFDKDECGIHI